MKVQSLDIESTPTKAIIFCLQLGGSTVRCMIRHVLDADGDGGTNIVASIGWSGQWQANVSSVASNTGTLTRIGHGSTLCEFQCPVPSNIQRKCLFMVIDCVQTPDCVLFLIDRCNALTHWWEVWDVSENMNML